ncbi:uncharacterized protein LOC105221175 [Zeugodacus cucurbitae]|uniref:uncharacterized protein LOC105221175 n=1 Tax=Zeugodacus cucurbitae TaxID=28588 RepID=UPI0005969226|nr:uncharacterized protein LOC105221175 [Zeugodacus cucurbitae]XP_054086063.1 uncharacterized protein LOC105221175 [Zeugodacus cucurbitae]
MAKAKTTIMDLNDDCLNAIFERLNGMGVKRNFSNTCHRFATIFCNHYIHRILVEGGDVHHFDSRLVTKFSHLLGTKLFPLRDIKSLKFDDTYSQYFTEKFFRALKRDHPNIESVELTGFRDKDMHVMLPFPNLKLLHFYCSLITGDYLDQLRNLEVLILDTILNFECRHLISIVQQNKNLQKLVLRGCPVIFTPEYAIEMSQNLNNLLELEANWYELHHCQLVGNLPCLKILVINDFKSFQCRRCRRIERGDATLPISGFYYGICECGLYDARVLFKGLRKKNILEQLIFLGSRITTRDLTFISKLTSLKTLYMGVDNVPLYISIAMFNNLKDLEDIDIGYSWKLPMEALSFLEKCQKLKYVNFGNSEGFDESFILEAIDVIKRRAVPPAEPLRMQFLNADFDRTFLEDERVKAAGSLIQIDSFQTNEMISRLYNYIYYF